MRKPKVLFTGPIKGTPGYRVAIVESADGRQSWGILRPDGQPAAIMSPPPSSMSAEEGAARICAAAMADRRALSGDPREGLD